jgi:hypothetical protein
MNGNDNITKSILKRSSTRKASNKRARIAWDEENLAENEQVQQSILEHCNSTRRIEEPKTPYVNYVLPDDVEEEQEEELEDMDLNDNDDNNNTNEEEEQQTENNRQNHMNPNGKSLGVNFSMSSDEEEETSGADTVKRVYYREVSSKIITPQDQMKRLQQVFARNMTTTTTAEDTMCSFSPSTTTAVVGSPNMRSGTSAMTTPQQTQLAGNSTSVLTDERDESYDPHEHESEEFARKRKQHYNEYLVMRQLREKGALNLDEEEEEEEEDDMDE